ncbi:hypothetical protein ACSVH2_02350 [Flavobacterium sp. RSB2_4_14]|uniref:hypothetical protein n=1 Tax=Flavobacterium sp. RSB2_4_14 TaxID=3447665 RepID=UPI003F331C6B
MKKGIYFLLLTSLSVSSQIKLVLKESTTGKPIPYAGIWSLNSDYAVTSNEKGQVIIGDEFTNDEFVSFTTGYESSPFKINKKTKDIFLSKSVIKTIPCDRTNEKLVYKNSKEEDRLKKVTSASGTILKAYLINCDDCNENSFLSKIRIGAIKNSEKNIIYKFRVFENKENKPGKEITQEPIIITVNHSILPFSSTNQNKVKFTDNDFFDIRQYNLQVTNKGFFVAFEILSLPENAFTISHEGKEYKTTEPGFNTVNFDGLIYRYTKGNWELKSENKMAPTMEIYIVK